MGILDDAIREHLELKRRAGADAAEIARLERTAFGDEAPPPAPAAVDPVPAEPAAAGPPVPAPEPPAAAEPEPAPAAPQEPEPVDQPTRQFTLEELEDAEQHPQPEPQPPIPPAEEGEVDELEETPEFLQETPEHDRLWFEQKPPKDFDF